MAALAFVRVCVGLMSPKYGNIAYLPIKVKYGFIRRDDLIFFQNRHHRAVFRWPKKFQLCSLRSVELSYRIVLQNTITRFGIIDGSNLNR